MFGREVEFFVVVRHKIVSSDGKYSIFMCKFSTCAAFRCSAIYSFVMAFSTTTLQEEELYVVVRESNCECLNEQLKSICATKRNLVQWFFLHNHSEKCVI